MVKRFLVLLFGMAVLYGCGGSTGSGTSNEPQDPGNPESSFIEIRIDDVELSYSSGPFGGNGTLNIYMTNDTPVKAFQFVIEGIDVSSVSYEGFSSHVSMSISMSNGDPDFDEEPDYVGTDDGTDDGWVSLDGNIISGGVEGDGYIPECPPGESRLLTRISFWNYQENGISFAGPESSFVTGLSGEVMEASWVDGTEVSLSVVPSRQEELTEDPVIDGLWYGSVKVYMTNKVEIQGFQFNFTGDIFVTGPETDGENPGAAVENGLIVMVGYISGIILGFSMEGDCIPVNEEPVLLVEIFFEVTDYENYNPEDIYFDRSRDHIFSDPTARIPLTDWGVVAEDDGNGGGGGGDEDGVGSGLPDGN